MVEIKPFILGPLQNNCFVINDKNKKAAIIDPGYPEEELIFYLKDNQLEVKYILVTHAHFDHVSFVPEIKETTGAKIAMAAKEIPLIKGSYEWGGSGMGYEVDNFKPDEYLEDGDIIKVGLMIFKVISTPGHSPGGVSFYLTKEKILFSGDTLFAGTVGRTDLPGSSEKVLWQGIKKKIFTLPKETRILPGHGPETSVGQEKELQG
ncbi:MAG: MBL fold metallo-hydrolase [Patescibacteria group bacterium]|nr:MBL fold metallo-hydrolase [Patescibacteria group bacterium]